MPDGHVAADDDRSVAGLHDDDLGAARVAGRRQESDPGQQLDLAVDERVLDSLWLDPLADAVVVLAARVLELDALDARFGYTGGGSALVPRVLRPTVRACRE